MAKAKRQTAPEAQTDDKYCFHKWANGTSVPVSLSKPLTDHGKKLISDDIDLGCVFEIIEQSQFDMLRGNESIEVNKPSDEKHAEVCKLVEYEPLVKKTVNCSKMFEHHFTAEEIKQKAMEFSEATTKKTDLEDELKSTTQYIKSQITEAAATINRISQELGRGKYSESVKCHWVFNDPCRGQKSLYRLDKEPKELVEVAKMTASDKQLTLDDIAAQTKKTERTVEEKEVTPVTNEPYDGEMMTDAEVKEETGVEVEPEETELPSPDDTQTEESEDCPI